ncbi:MAG TPA: FAD-binding oxidoreductase [Acidimicrobiia bacterium]|nr:FAD-binding oxidoreductase [Acidimicrobiia bacterium]
MSGGGQRSFWGWGLERDALDGERLDGLGAMVAALFGITPERRRPVAVGDLDLRPPRVEATPTLAGLCDSSTYERARHAYGRSYRDVVRGFRGEFPHPPDIVAFPRTEDDVVAVLDWCSSTGIAVVPYGGGSSVVGGVECDADRTVTLDLTGLGRVVEIDDVSKAARIQGGALGPAIEAALRPSGLTLRHYPQSFEFSTLGGWIATRSAGHHATIATHIEDRVESVRVVTPTGVIQTRRLPASGAGPAPERLFSGSEGTLGVITEAWVRVVDRPGFRAAASVVFDSFEDGVGAARALAQSGLHPANCRLLDRAEARFSGTGDRPVLLLGFESAAHPVDHGLARALECCADHNGTAVVGAGASGRDPAADTWRRAFFDMPYLRDGLVAFGAIAETFETAVTWDRFPALHTGVKTAVRAALASIGAPDGFVSCRFTHVYADGPAPYYTVIAPGRAGAELEQWAEVKAAASAAIAAAGGTATHHHAVGRDHRPGYDGERSDLFAAVLRAAKTTLDPAGVLNPGVLFDPE